MIATLLTLFYTDYAGVSVATVGLVMLISRFFDGGSDVVMGFIVDRAHSQWGQSRPWILWMSLPYALSAILLLITCFVKCEETVHIAARSEEKIPVGRSLKALVTNQYFWAVLLLWMFQSTNQAVVGTILPYYCKYVFHNDSWMYSTLYLSETIVLIVFTFLCPLLRDMLGKRNMIVAGAVLVLISQDLFFLNTTSFSWCLFTTMLRGVGEAPLCAFVFGMIGDVV